LLCLSHVNLLSSHKSASFLLAQTGRRLLESGGAPTATNDLTEGSGRRLLGSNGAPTATGEVAVDNGRRLLDAATSGDSADSSPTVRPCPQKVQEAGCVTALAGTVGVACERRVFVMCI